MAGLLEKIRFLAATVHQGQSYGDKPYLYHLMYVESVLERFGFDHERLRAAAWLHDSVEDTALTVDEVCDLAGPEVAEIVEKVTDKEGKNRRERHEKTYPSIGDCPDATAVKLADRIANVENCILDSQTGLASMYRDEHDRFREMVCRNREQFRPMWDHLDNLFEIVKGRA